jgi:hypothetical protein
MSQEVLDASKSDSAQDVTHLDFHNNDAIASLFAGGAIVSLAITGNAATDGETFEVPKTDFSIHTHIAPTDNEPKDEPKSIVAEWAGVDSIETEKIRRQAELTAQREAEIRQETIRSCTVKFVQPEGETLGARDIELLLAGDPKNGKIDRIMGRAEAIKALALAACEQAKIVNKEVAHEVKETALDAYDVVKENAEKHPRPYIAGLGLVVGLSILVVQMTPTEGERIRAYYQNVEKNHLDPNGEGSVLDCLADGSKVTGGNGAVIRETPTDRDTMDRGPGEHGNIVSTVEKGDVRPQPHAIRYVDPDTEMVMYGLPKEVPVHPIGIKPLTAEQIAENTDWVITGPGVSHYAMLDEAGKSARTGITLHCYMNEKGELMLGKKPVTPSPVFEKSTMDAVLKSKGLSAS